MTHSPTRRTFLGASVATVASAPRLVAAANDRIVVGVMGTGGRGTDLAQTFATRPNLQVAYVCDVDPARVASAQKSVAALSKSEPKVVGDFRRMLKTLLADRFQLKAHFEKKETPVYALIVSKGGPKFSASTTGDHKLNGVNGRNQFLEADRITMSALADAIWNGFVSDRPVIDNTDLTGTYKLRIEATPQFRIERDPQPGDLSIFTAVQEQLGLKLEPTNSLLDALVVDSAQQPSPN